jgi:hypothetical protein
MRLTPLAAIFLTAAVAAADDAPKPRPKLLGTIKVSRAVEMVHWTPDAKHLILIGEGKGLIVGRDQLGEDTPAKPVAEFDLPAGGCSKLGVTPNGTEVYAVANAGGRFNAETRLCFWALKDLLDGKTKAKPDRVVSLEADNPTEAMMAGDGKTLLAVMTEPRPTPPGEQPKQRGKVVRVSTKTGDTTEEVVNMDEAEATLVGATVHPASGRVVAHFQTDGEHVIRGIDTASRKRKWERRIDEAVFGVTWQAPRVSPDGSAVVAFCAKAGQPNNPNLPGQPQPLEGQHTVRPHLLNADTGAVIADLGADDVMSCDVCGFSRDGRLMFGWLAGASGTRHVVWETKTGKALKTWARASGVRAADFAPGKYELASVEPADVVAPLAVVPNGPPQYLRERVSAYLPDLPLLPTQQFQPGPQTSGNTSIVGVWDLSALVR